MIVITGHPRCGTAYMAALMRCFGFDIGHEELRRDGISAWSWAVCDPEAPWCKDQRSRPRPRSRSDRIEHLIHVVRHPADALWSIAHGYDCSNTEDILWRYTTQTARMNRYEMAAATFLGWNAIIAAQQPDLILRVEDAPGVIAEYFGRPLRHQPPPTDTNSRPKRSGYRTGPGLSERIDIGLIERLEEFCRHHGYDTEWARYEQAAAVR